MYRRMIEFASGMSEPQRVALLFMLLGVLFFLGGLLSYLENS